MGIGDGEPKNEPKNGIGDGEPKNGTQERIVITRAMLNTHIHTQGAMLNTHIRVLEKGVCVASGCRVDAKR